MLLFTLSMPNVGSWNGGWTGNGRGYYRTRRVSKSIEQGLDGKSFFYDFGDGWGARVKCNKINSREAAKMRKKSRGFIGYDWMISEILEHGKILTLQERESLR